MTKIKTQPRNEGLEASPDTRARLIEAAGEVFAEHGFAKATVRDICSKAGANVAAINYHFRDKETLYAETLKHSHRYALDHYPYDGGLKPDASAEAKLRAFVRSFVAKILDPERPKWHGRLMSREMTEPSPALFPIIEEGVRTQFAALCAIVRELAPNLPPKEVEACGASIIGQVLHYHHCSKIIKHLHVCSDAIPFDLELLTEHIARFSLAALEGLNSANSKSGGRS